MMRVSTRGHYGLIVMTELAQAYGEGRVLPLAEIASRYHLSSGYLEQVVAHLRRAGLVEGTRGVHGGYTLSTSPDRITVGRIIRVLEGPMELVECAAEDYVAGRCDREGYCLSKPVWQRVMEIMLRMLDSITLADVCREQVAAVPLHLMLAGTKRKDTSV
jgi:Rrf2 family protein